MAKKNKGLIVFVILIVVLFIYTYPKKEVMPSFEEVPYMEESSIKKTAGICSGEYSECDGSCYRCPTGPFYCESNVPHCCPLGSIKADSYDGSFHCCDENVPYFCSDSMCHSTPCSCSNPTADDGKYTCKSGYIYLCEDGDWVGGGYICGHSDESGDCKYGNDVVKSYGGKDLCELKGTTDNPCSNPSAGDGQMYCKSSNNNIYQCDDGVWNFYKYCSDYGADYKCASNLVSDLIGQLCVYSTCSGSSSQSCSVGTCAGTQTRTCNSGVWSDWGSCVKTDSNCGSGTCNTQCNTCEDFARIVSDWKSGVCSDTQYVTCFDSFKNTNEYKRYKNDNICCPSGTTKCPDGTCKANCQTTGCSLQSDCKSDQICEKSKCLTCEIYQSPKDNKCQMAMWVWIVAGVFGFMMIMMMMKK